MTRRSSPIDLNSTFHRLLHEDAGFISLLKLRTVKSVGAAGLVIAGFAAGFASDFDSGISKGNEWSADSSLDVKFKAVISKPLSQYVAVFGGLEGRLAKEDYYRIKLLMIDEKLYDPTSQLGVEFKNEVPVELRVTGSDLSTHELIQTSEIDEITGLPFVKAIVYADKLRFTANYITSNIKFDKEEGDEPMIVTDNSAITETIREARSRTWTNAEAACEILPGEPPEICNIFGAPRNVDEATDAKYRNAAMAIGLEEFQGCTEVILPDIQDAVDRSLFQMVAESYGISLEEAKRLTTTEWRNLDEIDTKNDLYDDYVAGGYLFEAKEAMINSLNKGTEITEDSIAVKCTPTGMAKVETIEGERLEAAPQQQADNIDAGGSESRVVS